jgi:selenocysteine lyase/cysteine desulfurase
MRIDGIGAQALTDWLLRKHRIHVRPRFVPDEWEGIRVTPNVFTTLEEVDLFAAAVAEAATSGAR